MSRVDATASEERKDSLIPEVDGPRIPSHQQRSKLSGEMTDVAPFAHSVVGTMSDTLGSPFSPSQFLSRQNSAGQNLPSLRSMHLPPPNAPSRHNRGASDSPHVLHPTNNMAFPGRDEPASANASAFSPSRQPPGPAQARPAYDPDSQAQLPGPQMPLTTAQRLDTFASNFKFRYHNFPPSCRPLEIGLQAQSISSPHLNPSPRGPKAKAAYLGPKHIPGKGMCHTYDDGRSLPVSINGSPVHPAHGVTKTGLPAKRTHAACLNCRNKKVKCEEDLADPSRPCLSCAKGGLDCRWSAHPDIHVLRRADEARARATTKSPETATPPQSSSRPTTPMIKRRTDAGDGPLDASLRGDISRGISSGSDLNSSTPRDVDHPPTKRVKLDPYDEASPRSSHHDIRFGPLQPRATVKSQPATYHISEDPYRVDSARTMKLLDNYFDYRDRGTTQVFPKPAFIDWVQNKSKSMADLFLLYSCLALGSVYYSGPKPSEISIAHVVTELEQVEPSGYSLQLALGRINLGLYYSARGECDKSFEMIGLSIRTLTAMRFNEEIGCLSKASDNASDNGFGLSSTQIVECRRRAFWLGYLAARYNGYCSGHGSLISDGDIFVRLPNPEADFEAGVDSVGPLFNEGDFDLQSDTCGEMGFLVSMISIWGDVTANSYRSSKRGTADYADRYEAFYQQTNKRIEDWEASLSPHLKYNHENTQAALKEQRLRSYYVLQACYHVTAMKLNRNCRVESMSESSVRRNIRAARRYARQYLLLVTAISKLDIASSSRHADLDNAICQPFPGYAILLACDILSRGGPASTLDETSLLVSNAEAVITEVARIFTNAKRHRQSIMKRVNEFGAYKMRASRDSAQWAFREPCDVHSMSLDFDVVYGVSDQVYHEAIA